MAVASLANRVQVNTNCGNNDALYGPYTSIDAALDAIPSALINGEGAIGRTIGVKNGNNVVEYWWQKVGDDYGFVIKTNTPIVNQTASESEVTIQPNVMNVLTDSVSSLTIKKGTDIAGIVNNYMIRFTVGEGTPDIRFDWGKEEIQWYGGNEIEFVNGNTYEISIVNNIALWAEFEHKAE